ncbi:MAG: hypothetical protein WCG55_02445 [bacterium]
MDSLNRDSGPRSNEQKRPNKEEKALQQAQTEMSYLENQYKNTRLAILRNPDPYGREHLKSNLAHIENQIIEIAEKNNLEKPAEVFARLQEKTPEDLKKEGMIELDKLRELKSIHELDALYGEPASRNKFYEFEHRARGIAKKYGLEENHIRDLIVPAEFDAIQTEEPKEGEIIPQTSEQKNDTEYKQSKDQRGFFKKLFGIKSKKEKEQEQYEKEKTQIAVALGRAVEHYFEVEHFIKNSGGTEIARELLPSLQKIKAEALSSFARLKPEDRDPQLLGKLAQFLEDKGEKPETVPLPIEATQGKDEKDFSVAKQSFFDRIKGKLRKYVTTGLFTLAATSTPIKTADQSQPRETTLAKTEAAAPSSNAVIAENVTPKNTEHKNHHVYKQKHSIETTHTTPAEATQATISPSNRAQSPMKKIDFAPLREVRDSARQEMLGERKIDTESIFTTPITQTETVRTTPEYAPLPTAPVSPDQSPNRPESSAIAPMPMGVYSAPAYTKASESSTKQKQESAGKIKVAYMDENGESLDTAAIRNEQKIVYTPMPKKQTVDPEVKKNTRIEATPDTTFSTNVVPAMDTIIETSGITSYPQQSISAFRQPEISIDTVTTTAAIEDTSYGWNWNRMHATPGYNLTPIETPTEAQWGNGSREFKMKDPETITTRTGLVFHHMLWERMDLSIVEALESCPAALEIYVEHSRFGNNHDPYTITLWNDTTGTEYLVAGNNMLAAAPQKRSRANEALFGRFQVSIEDTRNGKNLRINGADISQYEALSNKDKDMLALVCGSNGSREYTNYSINTTINPDGTVQKFDLNRGQNYALINAQPETIKKEIQSMIDFVRNTELVTEKLRYVEDHTTGVARQQNVWTRDYPTRPTREIATLSKKTEIREFKKNTPKAKNRTVKRGQSSNQTTAKGVQTPKKRTFLRKTKKEKEKFEVYLYH